MLICGEKGNLSALLHSVTGGEFICVYGVLTALFCVALYARDCGPMPETRAGLAVADIKPRFDGLPSWEVHIGTRGQMR